MVSVVFLQECDKKYGEGARAEAAHNLIDNHGYGKEQASEKLPD